MERVKTTICEMLNDRGYDVRDFDTCSIENIKIFILEDSKIGVKHIKEIIDTLDPTINHMIFVYQTDITTFAKQYINEQCPELRIELFSFKELLFNVTKHSYVPKHEIVTSKKPQIMQAFKIKKESYFPKILMNDPVAKYLGAVKGDLIKIYRDSEICGSSIYYRLCT